MTYIIILIIAIIIAWFLIDKREHDTALKKAGGIRFKYQELVDFLMDKAKSEVKSVDKGAELYLSYAEKNQNVAYYITEGFNLLLVKLTITNSEGEISNKWEFNLKSYTQQMMISAIDAYLNDLDSLLKKVNKYSAGKQEKCYLISSGIFPQEVLENDTLEPFCDLLEESEIDDTFKEAVKMVLIPYNISFFKFGLNREFFSDPYPIDHIHNHKQIAPSLIRIKKEKNVPMGYPLWFVISFPDVLYWILTAKDEVLSLIKEELKKMEDNQQFILNGSPTIHFFIRLINFYISNTNKDLECRNYNLLP